ncbi:MAG: SpoIIE family protein phosphatase [Flammeovirgaceae bacterium]
MILFWAMDILHDTIAAGVGGIVFLFPYFLHKNGKKFFARLLLCISFVLYFTVFSIFLGKGAGLEYVLIVAAVLPSLFFDKKRITIPLFIFSACCFAVCKISFYYLPIAFPHFAWVYIYDSVLFGVFLLLFLIINRFKRLQTRKENTITQMMTALSLQNGELNSLHAKLNAQTQAIEKAAIVARTDIKGRITYVNDNFVQISKFSREEVIGQTHQIINSGYHDKAFFKNMWQTIGNGQVWRGEFCNRAKDGSIYWVDSSIVPILNDKGKPVEYLAIRFVITKQKEAENQLKSRNAKITSSINYAQRIQTAIFPTVQKRYTLFPKHFIFYRPKDTVSGDFYWFGQCLQKKVIVAADCTGHGVPGAFMSMISTMILDKLVNVKGLCSPEVLLNELHRHVFTILKQEETGNQDGMDISICMIDEKNRELHFAGARNPLIYIQDGELITIKGDRMSIGGDYYDKPSFTNHIIPMTPATNYYIASDGFQDQFGGPNQKKYMTKRFRTLLSHISQFPLENQEAVLEKELTTWMKDQKQTDDILVIGFQTP